MVNIGNGKARKKRGMEKIGRVKREEMEKGEGKGVRTEGRRGAEFPAVCLSLMDTANSRDTHTRADGRPTDGRTGNIINHCACPRQHASSGRRLGRRTPQQVMAWTRAAIKQNLRRAFCLELTYISRHHHRGLYLQTNATAVGVSR